MEKYCAYCGKKLTLQQKNNTFCSGGCSAKYRSQQKVQQWLIGEFSGSIATGELSDTIRNFLLEKNNYSCEICGWNKINLTTGKCPLEIHHIDGIYTNNRPDNLQVLCPNCHSLTPNFKALNKSDRSRTTVRKKEENLLIKKDVNEQIHSSTSNYCCDCGKEISLKATRCIACANKQRITDKPVSREELKELIFTTPFTTIAKQFNVSDNAIRNWCKNYNLPTRKTDIKKYTPSQWEEI